jgi:hypothetical protein
MPEYNGNDIYLRINSVNVEARWRSFDPKISIGDEDVSAGAGIDWEKHASKLRNVSATITLVYDDTQAATDMAALVTSNDVVAIVYGPEGSAAGKPCHSQSFKVNGVSGPTTNHDKTLVTLAYDLISTGVPTKNIYAGDTF